MLWYASRDDILAHAAAVAPAEGLVVEFGVAGGATVTFLARQPNLKARCIYGFDSFKGLPEPWGNYEIGHFACEPPTGLPSNVRLVIGMFADTILPFLATHPGPAALLHIDSDLGSSCRTVLEAMAPRIVPGTIILLDEFWIVVDEEQRAFKEWLANNNRHCRPEARTLEQLCVIMD